jgi:hypothetical protein
MAARAVVLVTSPVVDFEAGVPITVELTPDEERLLGAVARQAGSTPNEWARSVVAERLAAARRAQAEQAPWPPRCFGIGTFVATALGRSLATETVDSRSASPVRPSWRPSGQAWPRRWRASFFAAHS